MFIKNLLIKIYIIFKCIWFGFHRHNSEIQQELNNYTKKKVQFTFTPHLRFMFRGILSTIYLDIKKNSLKKQKKFI